MIFAVRIVLTTVLLSAVSRGSRIALLAVLVMQTIANEFMWFAIGKKYGE